MKEVLQVIKERRSMRRFKADQITNKELNAILEAGLYAPSAHNSQSWHFTVIQNKALIAEIDQATKAVLGQSTEARAKELAANEKFHVFYEAPTLVIVSGLVDSLMPQVDCAAASQNMLLAAEAQDVGSCWIGYVAVLFEHEDSAQWIKRLDIPEGYKPYYALAFGYKGVELSNPPKRKENRINYVK